MVESGGGMIEKYLSKREFFGIKLGLDRVHYVLEKLGHPERELKFIHIAGTNGKGSTALMLHCMLNGVGIRSGLYTSPHLIEFGERFRIDGVAAKAADLTPYGEMIADEDLTYFEFATVLAILYFRANACKYVVWETGLGGRLDATNVVTPELSAITNIGLEHQDKLGDTLEKIAGEKAGIIKPGVPVFAGIMESGALEVICRRAAELNSDFYPVSDYPHLARYFAGSDDRLYQEFDYRGKKVVLGMPGAMQRRNFALAVAIGEYLSCREGWDFDRMLSGLSSAEWPGRLTILGDTIIDGAHNPHGIAALVEGLSEIFPGERFTVIFGAFRDKEVASSLRELEKIAAEFIFVPVPEAGRESYSAGELGKMVTLPYCDTEDKADRRYRKLVVGSLYLAGERLAELSVNKS